LCFKAVGVEPLEDKRFNIHRSAPLCRELPEGFGECVFDLLVGQVWCRAFHFACVFVVASPDPLLVF
jgi:hypothetical protein